MGAGSVDYGVLRLSRFPSRHSRAKCRKLWASSSVDVDEAVYHGRNDAYEPFAPEEMARDKIASV